MSQDALGQLKHLKTARARWPFPDEDLKNARGGAFCDEHELSYGNKCHIIKCE